MNDGFFSTSAIKLCAKPKLPPRLTVEMPPAVGYVPKLNPAFNPDIDQMVMDIECYINYFLIKFYRLSDGEYFEYERTQNSKLATDSILIILKKYEIITFNGNTFDIPILNYALSGANNRELKQACNDLIKSELAVWQFEKKHNLKPLKVKHIDLIELMPGMVSLKIFGGRLNCKKIQDLPYKESSTLTEPMMDEISDYCGNDLELTGLVYQNLYPQIELRRVMSKQYKIDLLSKSDAQIAETVIKAELEDILNTELKKISKITDDFYYSAPDFIQFSNPVLKEALEIVTTEPFTMSDAGRPEMPEALTKLKVKIGNSIYNMGMGGLHSTEKTSYHVTNDKFSIWDWDVTSYYPSIILRCGLYPKQLGTAFLDVYEKIVIERVAAKAAKDKVKADVLKIVVNGSYGKLGSPYSTLYAPDLMVQVTVTGQLALLMLIDMMEQKGIAVVSGNTDGIVLKCPVGKEDMMRYIIKRWEKQTGFDMEHTTYAGIYARDVNNYIAIKDDGEVKLKGCFAPAGIAKNPENEICTIAMINYIKYGTPFRHTIRNCFDITKFVTVRSVNSGGAEMNGVYIGKALRWYHTTNKVEAIRRCDNKDRIPLTEGCIPIMDITGEFPKDIDYDWYENKCSELF
jgi:DNA polymerase elongation subunit (family B)